MLRTKSSFPGRARRRFGHPSGFSFLEVQIAFILLGIGLAGLGPLIVIQVRLSKKIELGFNPQTAYFRPGTTSYLVPASSAWERKLGVGASLVASAPSSSTTGVGPTPAYDVSVLSIPQKALGSDLVTVHVAVTKRASSGGSP